MSGRKRLLTLMLVMATVAVSAASFVLWVLHEAAFNEKRIALTELVKSQARIIESIAAHEELEEEHKHDPAGIIADTLKQIIGAHGKQPGFGETGEFVLGRREGDNIIFLLPPRFPDRGSREPISFRSKSAEPMRRALKGQSGTLIGFDYGNVAVLAAHEPLSIVNLGIVAKIDVEELRAPFIQTGVISGGGVVLIILLGIVLFRHISIPITDHLEATIASLSNAQRIALLGNWKRNIETGELWWSEETYRIFGLDQNKTTPTFEFFMKCVHPNDRQKLQEAIDKNLKTKEPYSIDFRIIRPDGTVRVLNSRGEVILDRVGNLLSTTGTNQDITERKYVEEALYESEERLRRAVIDAPIPIMIHAEDGEVMMISQQWTDLTGYTHAEISTIAEWTEKAYGKGDIIEESRERIGGLYDIEEKKGEGEYYITTKSGKSVTWDFRSSPLGNLPDGRSIVISMAMDITERKASEQALRQSEDLLNSIIENVPVGLLIKGPDHTVERANRTYLNWYGFDVDTMEGRRSDEIENFQSTEEAAFMNDQEREVLNTGLIKARQVERLFSDGQIHTVNITKFPVFDQQGNITKVGSVSVDLTEQVHAQKVADTALQEAEIANQAKSEFLAIMSHEFRTPLNAILGFADILSNQYLGPIDGKYKEYADDIHSSGEHLMTLVNELLDLSSIERGKKSMAKEKLSTLEVVGECERIIESKVRSKGIDLVVKIPQDLPPLYADRRAAKQILLNLLSNAVKFTPKGGKITVSAKASKRNTTLTLSDTGKGIPPDKLSKLTDPFNQVDSDPYLAEQGWGLGLSITKSLVELHDGTLEIKSKIGKGTTVTVTFPNEAT